MSGYRVTGNKNDWVCRCAVCICYRCENNCEQGRNTAETPEERYCFRCDDCIEYGGKKDYIQECPKFVMSQSFVEERKATIERRAAQMRARIRRIK